jgi:tryptophan synthase alpha chain
MDTQRSTVKEAENIHALNASPATKISDAFTQAKREGRGVLMPYFMCGYPSASQSVELILAAVRGGADIIELGMPFSDPLADGATIQHASHIALERGMSISGCMHIAQQVSAKTNTPLLLMGYYNPVLAYGIERFCATAHDSGVSGLIIPDLPPEEAEPLRSVAQQHGLALVFLIPPTAPDTRIAQVVELTTPESFIYCVSLSGVTGARATLPANLQTFVQKVYGYTKDKHIPLVVGFGLSTPEHIAEVTKYADGAVIASALVRLIDQHDETEQATTIEQFVQTLRPNRR